MTTTQTETKKRRKRSPEFMDGVSSCREVGMSFIEAVRHVDETADEHGIRRYADEAPTPQQAAKAREKMRLEHQLATWNATVPPGTPVAFRHVVDGPETETRTRSEAWRLNSESNSVLLEGVSGGYCLDFVRVLPAEQGGA